MSRELLLAFVLVLPLLLLSLVVHELAHGWAAALLGDGTAREQGRLSFDPRRHLDALGSAVLVLTFVGSGGAFFFGWAKPVPVDPRRLADPQRGMMAVGAAGPAANVALALATAGGARLSGGAPLLWDVLALAFVLNVVLAVINLVPVPPLDGSRIVGGLLPRSLWPRWMALDRYGGYAMVALLVLLVGRPGVFAATVGAVLDWAVRLL